MKTWVVVATFVICSCAAGAQQPAGAGAQDKNQAANPPAAKTPPKKVHADLSGFELDPKKSGASNSLQIGAGSRGASAPPVLYAPSMGKAYTLQPTFNWGPLPGAQKFTFRLYDSNDDEVYEADVAGLDFAYPKDAPELKAGTTYSWTVQPQGAQLTEPPQPARIMLVGGSERQATQKALQNSAGDTMQAGLQRARVFVDHRLWYDAIGTYSDLIAVHPGQADLYRGRAEVYAQLPETKSLADLDSAKAEQLAGGRKD